MDFENAAKQAAESHCVRPSLLAFPFSFPFPLNPDSSGCQTKGCRRMTIVAIPRHWIVKTRGRKSKSEFRLREKWKLLLAMPPVRNRNPRPLASCHIENGQPHSPGAMEGITPKNYSEVESGRMRSLLGWLYSGHVNVSFNPCNRSSCCCSHGTRAAPPCFPSSDKPQQKDPRHQGRPFCCLPIYEMRFLYST